MEAKIEAVARALCTADGKDPDARTKRPGAGAGFTAALGAGDDGPALWEAYRFEAERFVVAIEAMQPFLDRAKRW